MLKGRLIIVLGLLVLIGEVRAEARDGLKDFHLRSFEQFIRTIGKSEGSHPERRLTIAMLLRFTDFGCVVCLNNFLDFCDTLNRRMETNGGRRVLMIFLRDESSRHHQFITLRKWAKVNRLPYPVYLAAQSVFDSGHVGHSSVALFSTAEEKVYSAEFPLRPEEAQFIIARIFNDK